jgi:hypothetical protein
LLVFGGSVSGTRTSAKSFAARRNTELRNNGLLYRLYSGFHHSKGNAMAAAASRTLLPRPVGYAHRLSLSLANELVTAKIAFLILKRNPSMSLFFVSEIPIPDDEP